MPSSTLCLSLDLDLELLTGGSLSLLKGVLDLSLYGLRRRHRVASCSSSTNVRYHPYCLSPCGLISPLVTILI